MNSTIDLDASLQLSSGIQTIPPTETTSTCSSLSDCIPSLSCEEVQLRLTQISKKILKAVGRLQGAIDVVQPMIIKKA